MSNPPPKLDFIGADRIVELLTPSAAVEAIEDALRKGLDPGRDFTRSILDVDHGQLLLMPAQSPRSTGVKVATVAPDNPRLSKPRIQAVYILFDAETLTPRMLFDGTALTALRTPAVSIAGVKPALLASSSPLSVVIFGAGPQGIGHAATIADVVSDERTISTVTYVVRDPVRAERPGRRVVAANSTEAGEVVRAADVIVCATGSNTPVFESNGTKANVIVIAVGSHDSNRREVDSVLVNRAQVVVEDIDVAMREGGDVIMAMDESDFKTTDLISMSEVVNGTVALDPNRAVLFKSSGMSWEDVVIADAIASKL
nr:ornithine cyclodeaminase family protein [Rhodococcus sp. (in: high G+C Gram-positive bacteria)]